MEEPDAVIAAAFIAAGAAIAAAFIAAGAALWIGWLQYRTTREQNRIAAFDKRLAVFKDAQIALGSVMQRGDADVESIASMTRAVQASWFLYPRRVSDHLTSLRNQMIDLNTASEMMRQSPPSPDHATHVQTKHACLKVLLKALEDLAEFFKPFVSLEPVTPRKTKQAKN